MASAVGQRRAARSVSRKTLWTVAGVTALVVFVVLIVGGYAWHWTWTGLSGSVTLWNWLEVLALPVAIGTAPLLLRNRQGLTRRHYFAMAAVLTAFGALALAGYLVPLRWTGFRGNTLWDWLQLVLLPVVVATTSSWWASRWRPSRRHVVVAATGATVFIMLVIAGYAVPMKWTGFTGNTMWDWVKLLLLPVVVPTVLVPLLAERMSESLGQQHEDDYAGGP